MNSLSSDGKLTRRSFLGWAIAALGALIAAFLSVTGLIYFVSPAFKRKEEGWVEVGLTSSIPRGKPVKLEFVERKRDAWVTTERRSSVWLLTANSRDFIAFDPRCTHLGCPYRWDEGKKQFLCPCHTAVFDVDGKVISGPPPRPLDRYPLKVVGGRILIFPQPTKAA